MTTGHMTTGHMTTGHMTTGHMTDGQMTDGQMQPVVWQCKYGEIESLPLAVQFTCRSVLV